jgi:hypothetical protein
LDRKGALVDLPELEIGVLVYVASAGKSQLSLIHIKPV